eukprot:m.24478 g.24478  ORF g.24478 m.24478 type:complete len:95 (-) comp6078_c0_seq1:22-306(-)
MTHDWTVLFVDTMSSDGSIRLCLYRARTTATGSLALTPSRVQAEVGRGCLCQGTLRSEEDDVDTNTTPTASVAIAIIARGPYIWQRLQVAWTSQ